VQCCDFYVLAAAVFLFVFTATPSGADTAVSTTPVRPSLKDFAGQIEADGKTGRVGIGTREPAATLDVYHGEIKLGSTGVPCTALLAGTLRYADNKLQLCDGARWRNVSLDKRQ
jgi:hypothetical protein